MAASSEEVMIVKETGGGTQTEIRKNDGEEAAANVLRWEKFLPRMVLKVLLVESDDSTRQIITALLRKCSYKVAAVSDGLKAWEVLKARSHNIDLILTEVELPSISGFALLTLITEHEVCKNIPVIMMSAHDSVSTVYKCMLRGAADFLVKPVRKNELKNLWQHAWRRRASSSGRPQAASDAQQKVEATAENNATSNHSSGYEACIQRNRECIEKGSDAQSSCTKPDLEAEEADMEHRQDLTRPKHSKSLSSDMKIIPKGEKCVGSERVLMHDSEAHGSTAVPKNANLTASREDSAANNHQERANVTTEAFDNDGVRINYSREAIDLIGAFDSYPKCSYKSSGSNYGTNKVDYSSLLDLSLRRSHPSGSVNQVMNDRNRLKQSDASAFSRYISSRAFQPLHSTSPSICNQQRGYETNSDKQLSHQALDYNSDTCGPTVMYDNNNMISLTIGQPEIQVSCPKQRATPVTVPVRDTRVESECTAFGKVMPPVFCTQSSRSPLQSPGSSGHQHPSFQVNQIYPFNPETINSQQLHYLMDQNTHNASELMERKKRHKLDPLEDRGHFSSATDQSGSASFCNGILSCFNSINSGSSGSFNAIPVIKVAAEYGNEATLVHDGNCHRSIQREAALTKFRMKRKDRCYEKKVRYESRRKLAEQRPRVKGQFVRQVQTESPSAVETDAQLVTSLTS